ncbi:MAG: ISMca6, transposase, OrfA [uncultured bacterium]|nr:MAG: ISMca6, transposase, OrfA [uncultured bacterium]
MLLDYLNKLQDKRRGQGKRYPLRYIILFSLLAIMCGANTYPEIARFIDIHLEELEEIFGIFWVKSPHQGTVRNILLGIDATELENALFEYNQSISKLDKENDSNIVAIDGKALRNSFDNMKDKKSLQMLEIFSSGANLIIGQFEIDTKSNEIPAAQKFIKESGLEGCIFTMDALHCQKKLLAS